VKRELHRELIGRFKYSLRILALLHRAFLSSGKLVLSLVTHEITGCFLLSLRDKPWRLLFWRR
jgi:hypothetical protein